MKLPALAIGIALLAAPAAAERLQLDELASRSELIAIGRVIRLHRASGRLLVHFGVERTLKGEPATNVDFVAPLLWSEPEFSNQDDRRLLVFLDVSPRTEASAGALEPSLVVISPDRLAYFELFENNGTEFATIWSDDLELPAEIDVATNAIAPDFIQNVPLRPLLAALSRILGEHDESPNPTSPPTPPR